MRWYVRLGPSTGRRPSSIDHARDERGSSLAEVLIAIAVLSILLLGLVGAMSTSANVSRTTGQIARTRAALAAVTDRVSTMTYPGCQDAASLTSTIRSVSPPVPPDGFTVTVTNVENLLPASASCTASTSVRMLTIRVDLAGATKTLSGQVVLRNPQVRPS